VFSGNDMELRMHSIRRLLTMVLLLAVASCTAPHGAQLHGSPMIDVPVPPFPYNSKFCT